MYEYACVFPARRSEITVRSNELEDGQRVASVRVSTSNAHADTLAGYLHRGDLYSASSMAGWAEKAEDLLEEKMADPFAAVVGAYLLLRTRNIELLHDWTRNLMDSFPRIPDAVVIRAWHLIYRRGDEAEIRHALHVVDEGEHREGRHHGESDEACCRAGSTNSGKNAMSNTIPLGFRM